VQHCDTWFDLIYIVNWPWNYSWNKLLVYNSTPGGFEASITDYNSCHAQLWWTNRQNCFSVFVFMPATFMYVYICCWSVERLCNIFVSGYFVQLWVELGHEIQFLLVWVGLSWVTWIQVHLWSKQSLHVHHNPCFQPYNLSTPSDQPFFDMTFDNVTDYNKMLNSPP